MLHEIARSRMELAVNRLFSVMAWQEAIFTRTPKTILTRQVKTGDDWDYPDAQAEYVKAMVSAQAQELRFELPNKNVDSEGKLEREPTVYIYSQTEIKQDYTISIGTNIYEQTAQVEEWPEGNPIYWKASCKPL